MIGGRPCVPFQKNQSRRGTDRLDEGQLGAVEGGSYRSRNRSARIESPCGRGNSATTAAIDVGERDDARLRCRSRQTGIERHVVGAACSGSSVSVFRGKEAGADFGPGAAERYAPVFLDCEFLGFLRFLGFLVFLLIWNCARGRRPVSRDLGLRVVSLKLGAPNLLHPVARVLLSLVFSVGAGLGRREDHMAGAPIGRNADERTVRRSLVAIYQVGHVGSRSFLAP